MLLSVYIKHNCPNEGETRAPAAADNVQLAKEIIKLKKDNMNLTERVESIEAKLNAICKALQPQLYLKESNNF